MDAHEIVVLLQKQAELISNLSDEIRQLRVLFTMPDGARNLAVVPPAKLQILSFLCSAGEKGGIVREISAAVGTSDANCGQVLRALLTEGKITRQAEFTGTAGAPRARYFAALKMEAV